MSAAPNILSVSLPGCLPTNDFKAAATTTVNPSEDFVREGKSEEPEEEEAEGKQQTEPKKKTKKYHNPFISPLSLPKLPPDPPPSDAVHRMDPDLPPAKRCRSGGEADGKVMLNYLPAGKEERMACFETLTKGFDVSKGFGNITALPQEEEDAGGGGKHPQPSPMEERAAPLFGDYSGNEMPRDEEDRSESFMEFD